MPDFIKTWTTLLAAASLLIASTGASAGFIYVGSWQVDEGPSWTEIPPAYTGQEAAALLFGGTASEYVISTIDNLIANADFMSWVSVWDSGGQGYCGGGFPCGIKVAQDFVVSTGALYFQPGDTSAYVEDWAVGSEYTNYAFRAEEVPLPATLGLFGLGLLGLGWSRRMKT